MTSTKTPSVKDPKDQPESQSPVLEDTNSEASVLETTSSEDSAPKVATKTPSQKSFKEAVEKVPSNWQITANEDGTIRARNAMTGLIYEGTVEDFNKALRS